VRERGMRALICAVLGIWLWAGPCVAQEEKQWFLNGKALTLAELKAAAEAGDVEAQVSLGTAYALGSAKGTMEEAISWWKKAADQGSTKAQIALGTRYAQGMGVEQNGMEALMWFEMAEKEDASADSSVGAMYEHGTGVVRSYEIAADWYRKGAERGDGMSQWSLGVFYENGMGVPFDFTQAKKWYAAAVAHGYGGAQRDLDRVKNQRWEPITRTSKDEVVSIDVKTVRRAQYPDTSQPISYAPLRYKMIAYTEAWFRAADESDKLAWRLLGLFDCRGRMAQLVYTDVAANTNRDVTNRVQQVGAEVYMERIAPDTVAEEVEKRVCGKKD
jgi:TPR repeat protein